MARVMLNATSTRYCESSSLDFASVVSQHLTSLRRRAIWLCRNRTDAEDVVQDTLLRALRSRHQLRSADRVSGWLMTTMSNTFIDRIRRRRARPVEVELAFESAAPEVDDEPPWRHLSVEDVRAAMAGLPDDVRDTYRMFALEGRDYVSIAAAQGIPKGTVGTRIQRARRQLRAALAASL